MAGVNKGTVHDPDEALHELMLQEAVVNTAVDTQVILRILVDKGIVTRDEVNEYRKEVRSSSKYSAAIQSIEEQKKAFQLAKDNPDLYYKAIFNSMLNNRKK